jgi:hypothetical protein
MAARGRSVWRDPQPARPSPRRGGGVLLAVLVGLVAVAVVLLAISALRFVF